MIYFYMDIQLVDIFDLFLPLSSNFYFEVQKSESKKLACI